MQPLRLGVLLPGGRPVGEGINNAMRAPVATARGEITAIIKELPWHELIEELLCALLGRELGLPIPEPLLIIDRSRQVLIAGSVDIGYPNLHQHGLKANLSIFVSLLMQWSDLIPSACFDEWIANPDRHGGNLLFDGQGFWLIDHGLALKGQPTNVFDNHLMALAVAARTDDLARQRLKREVLAIYRTYTEETLNEIERSLVTVDALKGINAHLSQCLLFLRQRLLALTSMTAFRIQISQGDLDYGD